MNYKNIFPEIFASIMATAAGVLIYITHLGFENYGLVIIQTVFLSYFIIFLPNIITNTISNNTYSEWYKSKSFMLLLCINILVIVGKISILCDTSLNLPFAIIGLFALLVSLIRYNKSYSAINSTHYYIFFIILGICLVTVPYTDYTSHPI